MTDYGQFHYDGDMTYLQPAWETWGIAARWNPQHGWHQPDAHPEHDTPTQTAS